MKNLQITENIQYVMNSWIQYTKKYQWSFLKFGEKSNKRFLNLENDKQTCRSKPLLLT